LRHQEYARALLDRPPNYLTLENGLAYSTLR